MGWNKTILAPMVWKPYDKTMLTPKILKEENFGSQGVKTILARKTLQGGETRRLWLPWCKNLTTRQFWLHKPYKGVKQEIFGSNGAKTLQQDNFGSINLTRRCDKTILAPMVRKPYDKTILAASITFPSQSDRSPVYLEDGNLPLAPPREYILVITSPWLTRPQEKKGEVSWRKSHPARNFWR